jgi:hypothetical protein
MSKPYRYCAYYCEENVWHLCQEPDLPSPRRVIFISNAERQVAMRHQRAGLGGLVFWDYHVVVAAGGAGVYDLDTTLGFPVDAGRYLDESFVADYEPPRFRVIDVEEFVRVFASDRSHMAGQSTPAPSWPPIGRGMNLMRFVDMEDPIAGSVVDLHGLRRVLGAP